MNERIKELKEQATVCTPHGHDGVKWIFNPELFAELIVLECAAVIEQNLSLGVGWNTSRTVKQHFGVKE